MENNEGMTINSEGVPNNTADEIVIEAMDALAKKEEELYRTKDLVERYTRDAVAIRELLEYNTKSKDRVDADDRKFARKMFENCTKHVSPFMGAKGEHFLT